jgi:hypothetical protein
MNSTTSTMPNTGTHMGTRRTHARGKYVAQLAAMHGRVYVLAPPLSSLGPPGREPESGTELQVCSVGSSALATSLSLSHLLPGTKRYLEAAPRPPRPPHGAGQMRCGFARAGMMGWYAPLGLEPGVNALKGFLRRVELVAHLLTHLRPRPHGLVAEVAVVMKAVG